MAESFTEDPPGLHLDVTGRGYGAVVTEQHSNDERIDGLKDRLAGQIVDEEGQAAPAAVVERVVDQKAEALRDQPIQDFVPLLVEHQVRDELRQLGLHRDLGDRLGEDEAAVPGDAESQTLTDAASVHTGVRIEPEP